MLRLNEGTGASLRKSGTEDLAETCAACCCWRESRVGALSDCVAIGGERAPCGRAGAGADLHGTIIEFAMEGHRSAVAATMVYQREEGGFCQPICPCLHAQ